MQFFQAIKKTLTCPGASARNPLKNQSLEWTRTVDKASDPTVGRGGCGKPGCALVSGRKMERQASRGAVEQKNSLTLAG
jgi:hypothetical protein